LQTRLTKYVLRAHVSVKDATADHALFGISGDEGGSALRALGLALPNAPHDVVSAQGLYLARLPLDRYFLLSGADDSARVRAALAQSAQEDDESSWSRLDIEAGIPVITSESEDQYIPQMVNLDLIGGVSYTKGCYPGQEIVARTHYLGRLKQRMYRIRVPLDATMRPGDSLFSPQFGEQASGTIVQAALTDAGEYHALAVIQTAAADSGVVRLKSPGGPAIEFLSLPYALPS
jgi:folate-binding protein YgfZ